MENYESRVNWSSAENAKGNENKTDEMSRQHDKISGPEVGAETVTDAGSFSFFSEGKQIKVNKHADIRQ